MLRNKQGQYDQFYRNEELIGLQFAELTVLELVGRNKYNHFIFKCLCTCGRTTVVAKGQLCRGTRGTKSCGCKRSTPKHKYGSYKGGVLKQNILAYMPNGVYSSPLQQRCVSIKKNINYGAKGYGLTDADLIQYVIAPCHYCGIQDQVKGIGIDRVDPKIGYFKENCVSCCKSCNFAKNDMTVDQFRGWLKRLCYNYLKVAI